MWTSVYSLVDRSPLNEEAAEGFSGAWNLFRHSEKRKKGEGEGRGK